MEINKTRLSSVNQPPKLPDLPSDQAEKLRQSAEEFEAIFVGLMLKSMRDSVQKSGLLDGGNGEDIFRGMLDAEYSKAMAAERKTEIADAIEREMKELLQINSTSTNRGQEAYRRQNEVKLSRDLVPEG
jgi:Rod binding domain-containing protein